MSVFAYDEVDYPYSIRTATHVSRLASVARVLGHPAAPVERCNVLEIGGGDGVNLINMALGLPDASFLSVDLSERAVGQGQDLLKATGVTNVALAAVDLRNISHSAGPFDYVIAHGVYAWVPQAVREAILALIGRMLSPRGVAMISYNAQPGCRPRQVIRDLLLHATRGVTDPQRKIAVGREALQFYVDAWDTKKALPASLNDEARGLLRRPAALMFHDEMGEVYHPQLVSDVAADAARHGLAYLGDTQNGLIGEAIWPADLFEQCRPVSGGDFVQFEQVRDFIETRCFRQTLLTRAGAPVERRFDPSRIRDLYVDGRLERIAPADAEEGEHVFKTPHGGEISTRDPRFAAGLDRLAEIFPASARVSDLFEAPIVLEALTNVFLIGGVDFISVPFPVRQDTAERPRGSRLARAEVALGRREVSALRHNHVRLDESGMRFLERLDGNHDAAQLAVEMGEILNLPLAEARTRVDRAYVDFNRLGLIEA